MERPVTTGDQAVDRGATQPRFGCRDSAALSASRTHPSPIRGRARNPLRRMDGPGAMNRDYRAAGTGITRPERRINPAARPTAGRRVVAGEPGASNGTFVGPASGPLPEQPINVGPRTELDGDDRVYVGAWTRIVVRQATDEEIEANST